MNPILTDQHSDRAKPSLTPLSAYSPPGLTTDCTHRLQAMRNEKRPELASGAPDFCTKKG